MARRRKRAADYSGQIRELYLAASELEPGPAKVAVLEEAVRLADAHNDVDLGMRTRQELIQAATFGGRPDVSMVAFAWCLAQLDKDPDRFDSFDLLWKYKWVLDSAPGYPQISRRQITDMLADMERRYRAEGTGLHPVHQMARDVYWNMGDLAAAKTAHAKVLRSVRNWLSDCPACEQHAQVKLYLDTGRPKVAFRKAEPLVSGRMSCAAVPHVTYSVLLMPMLSAGEAEKAAEYHREGVRLIGTNPKFLRSAAQHVLFLVLTDNLTAAAKLLERHLPNAAACTCPGWRFEFDRAAAFLFDRFAELDKPPRVRFPPDFPLPEGVDRTDPAALRDHFLAGARELAKAFDARNGNDWYTRQLDELPRLKKCVTPYKL